MAIGSMYESTYCIGRLFILLEIQELPDLALKIMFLRYICHIPSRADIFLVITAVLFSILAWHHTTQELLGTCNVICRFRKMAHAAVVSTCDRVLWQLTLG